MMSFRKYSLIAVLLLILNLILGSVVLAQSANIPYSLELTSSNENPGPGETVKITAKGYGFDIDSAKITWSSNGRILDEDIGLTEMSIIAPILGQRAIIEVTAKSSQGKIYNNSIAIQTGSVDMILESDGYVPPLFRGKVNPSYQNTVKISAIPHLADSSGKEFDPKTLIYEWRVNERILEKESGYGKQSISIKGDIVPRPYIVKVAVSTRDGKEQSEGRVSVDPQEPKLLVYIEDPLYGPLYNKAISGSVSIGSQKETTVLTVPYGFNKGSDIFYSWNINGVQKSDLTSNESVVLRSPEGSAGSSNIEIVIRNNKEILQRAAYAFSVNFQKANAEDIDNATSF